MVEGDQASEERLFAEGGTGSLPVFFTNHGRAARAPLVTAALLYASKTAASRSEQYAEGNLTCDKIVRNISLVTENPRREVLALNVYPYPNPTT